MYLEITTVFAVINPPGAWLFFQGGCLLEVNCQVVSYFTKSVLGGQSMFPSVKCSDESDCEADGIDYSTDYDSPGH